MRRSVLIFILSLFVSSADVAANADPREYANWSAPKYAAFVKLGNSYGRFCTGQFVSPTVILTNEHCVQGCTDDSCHITTADGGEYRVQYMQGGKHKLAFYSMNIDTSLDFAFFEIIDTQYKSEYYFPVANTYYTGKVFNAGFGALRVLSDKEIQQVRKIYVDVLHQDAWASYHKNIPDASYEHFQFLSTANNRDEYYKKQPIYQDFLSALDDALVANGIAPIFQDGERFKVNRNCKILKSDSTNLQHTCWTSPGNSGGGLISPSGNLVGIVCRGIDMLHEFGISDLGLASPSFYEKYKQLVADEAIQ